MVGSVFPRRFVTRLVKRGKSCGVPFRYVYSKLDSENDIRLITLLPSKFHDPIRIKFAMQLWFHPIRLYYPRTCGQRKF
jgi:hypothetical protein